MEAVRSILREILGMLPFVGLCLAAIKYNLPKSKRYAQSLIPVAALIYCSLIVLDLDRVTAGVIALSRRLISSFPILSFLERWINLPYGLTVISNMAIILGFLGFKTVLLPLLLGLNASESVADLLSGKWYHVRESDQKRYVNKSTAGMRRYFLWMYIAAIISSSLFLILIHRINNRMAFSAVFYPAFGIILLGEVYFFLNGKAEDDPKKRKADEAAPEDTEEEIDYEKLVPVFQESFPARFIKDDSSRALPPEKNAVADLLDSFREEALYSSSHEAALMYEFFAPKFACDEELDDGMLRQSMNLLLGKSVIYFTLFYEDTTKYIFLPVQRHLMRGKKVLVILGRDGTYGNLRNWFAEGLAASNNIYGIWKVDDLNDVDEDTSVAILQIKDIYNQKLLAQKSAFLEGINMVFLMEPSRLLSTMQLGLSAIVGMLNKGRKPQYIAFDRNCDGLVDSLSHVIGSSLEHVNATTVGISRGNTIFWDADGENLHHKLGLENARYLGVGTELAVVGIREGVSAAKWVSAQKFPVTDIEWIVSQYYPLLCAAMKLPVSQNELSKHLAFIQDIWSVSADENAFLVIEDEYNNAFESARQFATRGKKQTFINVISQNYWLREYMTENAEIFHNDPKAVPNFVADYQRSTANVVYKIIMMLIDSRVDEEEIADMLETVGISTKNVYRTLIALIKRYFFRTQTLNGAAEAENAHLLYSLDRVIQVDLDIKLNEKTLKVERKRYYSIRNKAFIDALFSQLKVSYYLAEDEKDKNLFLGSILYGHVYQKYLPGMFVTRAGKYYEVVSVTGTNGVLVRRAADHITARRYYRHLRTYDVECYDLSDNIGSVKVQGNISFEHCLANILVKTTGYLEMTDYGDLQNAKRVEINHIPDRQYTTKDLIRIRLDGSTPAIRYTISALLNELFVTVFPDTCEYICATTHIPDDIDALEGLIPELTGEDDEYIYIIEDSLIDLGLLINVDRYFNRFLEIICDVLEWHKDKLAEEEQKEPQQDSGDDDEGKTDEAENDHSRKRPSLLKRILEWLRLLFGNLFGRRKKKKTESAADSEHSEDEPEESDQSEIKESVTEDSSHTSEEAEYAETPKSEETADDSDEVVNDAPTETTKESTEKPENLSPESSSDDFNLANILFDLIDDYGDEDDPGSGDEIEGEDSESTNIRNLYGKNGARKKYSERHYLLYGRDNVPQCIAIDEVIRYLTECGFENNYLKQSRVGVKNARLKYYNYQFEPGQHYCDFCGKLMDEEFDVLNDGRERCAECAKTAVVKLRHFKKIYKSTRKQMENIFDIHIKTKIKIRMTNAKAIAEHGSYSFKPTSGFDSRAIGFAQRSKGNTYLYLENGAPLIETKATLVHELTHIWQYENLPEIISGDYDKVVVEGMAVWSEVQYLTSIGETERADDYARRRIACGTEYGVGLEMYLKKYKIQKSPTAKHKTPFRAKGNPLS